MIDEELVRLIRAAIQDELRTARLKVPEVAGSGGNTVISSRGDIILSPGIGRKVYYQKSTGRVEVGEYVPDEPDIEYLPLGGGTMTGDITHNSSTGDKYYTSSSAVLAGHIRAFAGSTLYDFVIETNGVLFMQTGYGVSLTGDIIPSVTNTYKLGTSTRYWSGLYATNIFTTDIIANDISTSSLSAQSMNSGHIYPHITNTYKLGSSTKYWSGLYAINIFATDIIASGDFGASSVSTSTITISGGTPGAGKVLTSDSGGAGTWQTPAAGGLTNPLTSRLTLNVNGYSGSSAYLENDASGVTTIGTKTKLKIVVA